MKNKSQKEFPGFKLREEVDKMLNEDIIKPLGEPTEKALLEYIKEHNIRLIRMMCLDYDGIPVGETVTTSFFLSKLNSGEGFDGSSVAGMGRRDESDMLFKSDLSTVRLMPWHNSGKGNMACVICDVLNPDGSPYKADPRYILKRNLADIQEKNYDLITALETEFTILETVDENGIPVPIDKGKYFTILTDKSFSIRLEMMNLLEKVGVEVGKQHHECGDGQGEIGSRHHNALRTADDYLYKIVLFDAIASKHGVIISRMPKIFINDAGNGFHCHVNIIDLETRENLFYNNNDPYGLSEFGYRFLAGVLDEAEAVCSVACSTYNSFKRLDPEHEAPNQVFWAARNRGALVRIPSRLPGKEKTSRIEFRLADPLCNIYLFFAILLKAGWKGVQNKEIIIPKPVENDINDLSKAEIEELGIRPLQGNLFQSMQIFKSSKLARETFGELAHKIYYQAKMEEWKKLHFGEITRLEYDFYLRR